MSPAPGRCALRSFRHVGPLSLLLPIVFGIAAAPAQAPAAPPEQQSLRSVLDAPLLFVKRHPYMAGHIYDDYLTWHPGGGIYVVENPRDPPEKHRVRPVIDPTTKETLGEGVYRDPELSWDAKRIVFAFKGDAAGSTSLYEIGIDGTGLRQLTFPCDCEVKPDTRRIGQGHHDITPCYLPDGRIVFTSTRPGSLVPCFNSGVDTLHVMNADGSGVRGLSVNNVTEFDPAVLADGRILYGRWEYVDKTALYMQSLWTMSTDGRMEEALFANNLAKPTAVLDARPVPGSHLICAALTPHNGQSVGAIVMIDPRKGKNDLGAIINFTPEYPAEMDQGLRQGPSDPWPLSEDVVVIANNAKGHGVLQILHRDGRRELLHAEPDISCYSPMLIKPRPAPPAVPEKGVRTIFGAENSSDPFFEPGRFLVADVHEGLAGVEPGTIKRLRIVEETARVSGIPPGGRWWNQAFLISWQGGYVVKNVLGTVPVHEDGSAYFEVPAGKAVYFEALDADGREVQRMRTFAQAAPGVTRSCVGCHENKYSAPVRPESPPLAMLSPPAKPEPESWGSGLLDYPTMVQPVLDKHCVRCHGGPKGIAKGLDFSGGWTWAFNISYETLIKNRLVGFLNCNNGSVHTSRLLAPRTIGSGGAKLATILIKKHPELSPAERDVMLAWMDLNSCYFGTWDYTPQATCEAILQVVGPLGAEMQAAGCTECHQPGHVGNDWVNLQTPEHSRILRAPMAKGKDTRGVAFCRDRKARTGYPLITQRVQPPDVLYDTKQPPWDESGEPHVTFTSTDDEHYRAMLEIIRHARAEALSKPRVDMPGAEPVAGECRVMVPLPVPAKAPELSARLREDYAVGLCWPRTADTLGMTFELHRGERPAFTPSEATRIGTTIGGRFVDPLPPVGQQHYAVVAIGHAGERSGPAHVSLTVPEAPPPEVPVELAARGLPGEVVLQWNADPAAGLSYDLYRREEGKSEAVKLNAEPIRAAGYRDVDVTPRKTYVYQLRAVDRRGRRSEASPPQSAAPLPEIKEPVFVAAFDSKPTAALLEGKSVAGKLAGGAKATGSVLDLAAGGYATFDHLPEFDLGRAISVECWLRFERESQMPVILSCGAYQQTGWFLQRYGGGWRWHLGGVSCDGGRPVAGEWVHLVGTFDGRRAVLFQDGKQVAAADAFPNLAAFAGPLVLGQYSNRADSYQVFGQIAGVKIYRRALKPDEPAASFKAGPPK